MIDRSPTPAALALPGPPLKACVARKRSVRSAKACGVAAARVPQLRNGSGAFLAVSLTAVIAAGAIAAGDVAHLELKLASASIHVWATVANAAAAGL